MRSGKVLLGLVLLAVGVLLLVGFWPLASYDGRELLAARSGNDYVGFAPGDTVLFRGLALDVAFVDLPFTEEDFTLVEVQDGDPDEDTVVVVRGDARGRIAEGSEFYATLTLRQGFSIGPVTLPGEYWEMARPEDARSPFVIDAVFGAATLLGGAVLVLGLMEGRRLPT